LTITDPGIVAGDTVYEVTSAGLVAVGTATADGVVSITFSNDPTFVVAAALLNQSPISITSLTGVTGTSLTLETSGGLGTGVLSFAVMNGTASGCVVSGTSLSTSSAGTCLVTATKAADGTYDSASSAATTITFALEVQSPIEVTSTSGTVGTATALTTSGGSGTGAVNFSVANGTATGCAITAGSLSATSAGTCVVTATKAADASYSSASSTASVTFAKAKAAPSATPSLARASPISLVFTYYSSALTNSTRAALIDLSRKLVHGASVKIIGYADFDIPLATSRANAVKKFLQGLVPVKVKIEIVTNLPIRKVKVINTAT
jgi:hypothetical protein